MKLNAVASLFLAVAVPAVAQVPSATTPSTLKEVAQRAVLNSPEVTSKWHNYRAA